MMTIVPHHGAGNISFGMTRDEVVRALGRPPAKRSKLRELDASEIDFFDGFAVHYDANDKCNAIEFHRGGMGAVYDGYELFAHTPDQVRAWARLRDPNMEEEEGFVSKALGLSMYAPFIDAPDLDDEERAEPAQSFFIFRPGYWEEEDERLRALGVDPDAPSV